MVPKNSKISVMVKAGVTVEAPVVGCVWVVGVAMAESSGDH